MQGTSYINNPIRRLLVPRRGQKVVVSPTSVNVYGVAWSYGPHKDGFKAVDIFYSSSSGRIDITIFEERRNVSVPPPHFTTNTNLLWVPCLSRLQKVGTTVSSNSTGNCGTETIRYRPRLMLRVHLRVQNQAPSRRCRRWEPGREL